MFTILIDNTWCDATCPYFQVIKPGSELIARCNKLGKEPIDYYDGFIAECQPEETPNNE